MFIRLDVLNAFSTYNRVYGDVKPIISGGRSVLTTAELYS